jgi:competence protein ComEA
VRGEPERVAERVRRLLEESGRTAATPSSSSPDPAAVAGPAAAGGAAPPADRPGWRERLAARVPVRLDPGRRGALAVGAAVVVAAAASGAWVLAARPSALPVSSSGPTAPAGAPSAKGSAGGGAAGTGSASEPASPAAPPSGPAASATAAATGASSAAVVVVDVAGRVRHPGVYRLPLGARVDDAVRAAGGAVPGVRLDRLNLAAKLVDGQQVPVGVAPAPDAGGGAGPGDAGSAGGSSAPAGGPVDLNTATLEQLQTLPGVGPVLGQHILDWRAQHGRFTSVDQLNDVPGIGDVKFAALKPLVTL